MLLYVSSKLETQGPDCKRKHVRCLETLTSFGIMDKLEAPLKLSNTIQCRDVQNSPPSLRPP